MWWKCTVLIAIIFEFVARVTKEVINQLKCDLLSAHILNQEEVEVMQEQITGTDMARVLLAAMRSHGNHACRLFIILLQKRDPFLTDHLGLSGVIDE